LPKIGLDYGIKLGARDKADEEGFFKHFKEYTLPLVRDELIARYDYMCNQSPQSAPFIYDNDLMMDADKCKDTVRECLKHGTNAIGILGMAECCIAMFGKHHGESEKAYNFALKIVRMIDEFCKESSEKYQMNFGQYFSPAENLCKTAVNTLKIYYGEVEGVTTRPYLTNSIHIPVYYQLDAYSKLTIEAPFTQYGTSGCISYVELDNNAINNLEGLEKLIDYAMDLNIPYLAINFPIDTCKSCGYSSQITGDKCPVCGSSLIERLKRVTGYITVDYRNFNAGKFAEANDRVTHTIFNPSVIPIVKLALKELEEMKIGKFDILNEI
jgi:ribonucleoside-triphosphate reductase